MILILLVLAARMAFLAIIFLPDEGSYAFKYALWVDQFPNIFKYMIVVYICKYKLHIHYLAKR